MDHDIVKLGSIVAAEAMVVSHTLIERGSRGSGIQVNMIRGGMKDWKKFDLTAKNYNKYAKWY
jgi:hypothetical protein